MQVKRLYSEKTKRGDGENRTELKYYIVERMIGEQYCELKSYGVQIKRIELCDDDYIEESRLIGDIFFDEKDAENFVAMLAENTIKPSELRNVIDKYVADTIAMRIENKTA